MRDRVRWGIVGCGDVTEVKSGPAFAKAAGSALVAVTRRDRAKAEDYARRHGVPRVHDDAAGLIADPDVDAVYVATPPSTHLRFALMAAAAGKPAYVEKPMALDHRECEAMLAAFEERGVPLFVAYYRRALPRFLEVKRLLASGALGAIRLVTVTVLRPAGPPEAYQPEPPWRVVPAIAGGGLFVDLAAHVFDLLDFLLGPIASAAGQAANQGRLYEAEDAVVGHFTFRSGVLGTAACAFTAGEASDRVELVGSAGTLRFSVFDEAPITLVRADGSSHTLEIPHPPHVQQPLIQTVVDALLGRGECPSSGRSAARASWVMDQMLADWRRRMA